jgi:hypothetical protein
MTTRASTTFALFLAGTINACSDDGGGGAGGAGGTGVSVPATPPADVCALLTQTDVRTILPSAGPGKAAAPVDTPDLWVRLCTWTAGGIPSVDLVVHGALTEAGRQQLAILATVGPGDGTKTPVSGLGDSAVFWEDADINTLGLTALRGNYSVDVTAYFLERAPTQAQLIPLVRKAFDGL